VKVGFPPFWHPFVDFLQGKWAKMGYLANCCSVLPHFCCNDIYLSKNTIEINMTEIGAVGGEFWRIGSEMLGSRHGKLDMCPLAGNTQGAIGRAGHALPM
jgi:hypothetical protein